MSPVEIIKRREPKLGKSTVVVGCAILLLCLAEFGYCESDTALMLEISPVNGGTLNLSPGVYNYDRNAAVTLTAVPRPGYQFVYWVGSVDNATTSSTMVYLDSPKIVIAVFERTKFDFTDFEEGPQGSAGGGRLIPSGADYAAALEQAVVVSHSPSFNSSQPPDELNDDVPVPEEGDDFPVPTPEPATVTLLLAGTLALAGNRRRRVMHRQTI